MSIELVWDVDKFGDIGTKNGIIFYRIAQTREGEWVGRAVLHERNLGLDDGIMYYPDMHAKTREDIVSKCERHWEQAGIKAYTAALDRGIRFFGRGDV